jgi:uncharacterized protein (DUF1330 family)
MAAYMLAVCKITNPGPELKEYSEKSGALAAKHGGKYILRGPAVENYEGDKLAGQIVIMSEFPSMDDLKAFIDGDEYKAIKHLRESAGEFNIAFYESPAS